jgi:hypothetical protein
LCLVFSQGVPEVRKELGSFVNRELAKRLKALIGPRDDFLCLRGCEVRECFDLLTSRRVYSCKSCLIHILLLSLLVINDRVRSEALRTDRWMECRSSYHPEVPERFDYRLVAEHLEQQVAQSAARARSHPEFSPLARHGLL